MHHRSKALPAAPQVRILMLLENESYPDDSRVALECRTLCDAGHRVVVICPSGVSHHAHELVNGVHVYRYPKPRQLSGSLGYLWEYGYSLSALFLVSLYVLVRHGFDVVHAHAPPDMLVLIAGVYKLVGKRFVFDQHDLSPELYQARQNGAGSQLLYRLLCRFERLACRVADRLIATNETQRRMQIERGGACPERCHVVRNGPDARFLTRIEPLASLRGEGRVIIGYVGMLGVQDGVDYLLRALACLRDEGHGDRFRAVVVGSGPALGDLRRLSIALSLERLVRFVGYRTGDDLLRHIASFDIGVTPDPSNPYNDSCTTVKSMEYMAMARPVVAFDLPENRVTLADAALYAIDNDVLDLAGKIAWLMDRPRERQRLGRLGRQRIIERFAWERQQGELLRVYEALLGGATPGCAIQRGARESAATKSAKSRQGVASPAGVPFSQTAESAR